MDNMSIKHFEELWNEAEQISIKTMADKDVVSNLIDLLTSYKSLSVSELPQEVVASLRKRYMGEIVFLLTAISANDNINVYGALMEEVRLNS